MRRLSTALASATAVLALTATAWGQEINGTCPVRSGKPIKSRITVRYKGKVIAFCCTACREVFGKSPKEYLSELPGLRPVDLPESKAGLAAGIKAARDSSTPLAVYFVTSDKQGREFEENVLRDYQVGNAWTKVTFVKIPYDKDSEDAKKLRVRRGPALVILDCRTPDEPKTIKLITRGSPRLLKAALEKAAKDVAK